MSRESIGMDFMKKHLGRVLTIGVPMNRIGCHVVKIIDAIVGREAMVKVLEYVRPPVYMGSGSQCNYTKTI